MTDPFTQMGLSFAAIGRNMIFMTGGGTIFGQMTDIASSNAWGLTLFNLLVEINLFTAVFNIIPIPPLDGYKIVAKIYESKTHKKVNEKLNYFLLLIGILLLLYILFSSIICDFI